MATCADPAWLRRWLKENENAKNPGEEASLALQGKEEETIEGVMDTVLLCLLFVGTAGLALSRKMSV
eukprot:CAMPEP_0198726636 /NCGR_PEP_ID=MMETSP1475-20131203/3626_1 /TAXON_ID= ORGANISM="Unidentified sp., Strain CCMP1999" /NCGR_SAMPLE_ID=MMETSP1475 /ASSEMBLY_ACC=CAM_ASM_001111 /LENGTH=66 /DNA_ID=CAMNT_0044488581 /DNA_START=96 /DNA_END=296 /DNA_ORIENTATION=-